MACTLVTTDAPLSSTDKADLEIGRRLAAKNNYRKFGDTLRLPTDGVKDVDPGFHHRMPEETKPHCKEVNSPQNHLISLGRSYRALESAALEAIKKIDPELASSQDPLREFAKKHLAAEEFQKWALGRLVGRHQPGNEFEVIKNTIGTLTSEERADPTLRRFTVRFNEFASYMNSDIGPTEILKRA